MRTITVRGQGIVLDALLAAEFGPVLGRRLVAETLDLNPGLADFGPELPIGVVVTIPDAPAKPAATVQPVSLFG